MLLNCWASALFKAFSFTLRCSIIHCPSWWQSVTLNLTHLMLHLHGANSLDTTFVGKQIHLLKGHNLLQCVCISLSVRLSLHQHSSQVTHTWLRRHALLRHSCLRTEEKTGPLASNCRALELCPTGDAYLCYWPAVLPSNLLSVTKI